MRIILICFLSLLSTSLYAGGQGGAFKVSSLRVGSDGVYVKFSPAPAACNGGNQHRMHARVRHTDSKNYDSLLSTLLAAHTSGATLYYIWFNDLPSGVSACSNTANEILELTMVELSHK
jgi:hypothetical protein